MVLTNNMGEDKSILKDKYFLIAVFLIIASISGIYFGVKYLLEKTSGENAARKQCYTEAPQYPDISFINDYSGTHPWWNDEYTHFKQVTLENKDTKNKLTDACWITLQFNHSLYVEDKKSKADGGDLRIVYYENESYTELPVIISEPNTSKTRLFFLPVNDVEAGGKDESYFLYYGNQAAELSTPAQQEEEPYYSQNYKLYINRETNPKIFGQLNRHWFLRGQGLEDDYSTLEYTVSIDESIKPDTTPYFELLGTPMKGDLEFAYKGEYEAEVDISTIPPGAYQIQTTVISNGETYKSIKSHIFISYPLYVVWTMDWEGTGVPQDELDRITTFSSNHDAPITHFFNPRIYVTSEVSEEEAKSLTSWIQNRQINGDEIGLHLHMHYDLVSAAGVEVRTSPKWTNYLNNGHDVPCSAYTLEEFSRILMWSKQEFLNQGLGVPSSFRAGGWFADTKVLQALEDNGIRIDSSGRSAYTWGSYGLKGYWNLAPTTKPYFPSKSNQNSSSPSPNFGVREFPNNGADSWFYTSDELIDRFNQNYSQGPLSEAQVITYLSHPHQIHIDMEVLEPTYNYIDNYKIEADQGPVIYVTLIQADTFLPR